MSSADTSRAHHSSGFQLLSELIFSAPQAAPDTFLTNELPVEQISDKTCERVLRMSRQELEDLKRLAEKNHVIVRAFRLVQKVFEAAGNSQAAAWTANALQHEHARIEHALKFLQEICTAFEKAGCRPMVIKSLDHWPDLGSDLDLYTDADSANVIAIMLSCFEAQVAPRSWGDRLANKWNFVVPGLPELVEVHIGRLGQTGEQTMLTRSLASRTATKEVGQSFFRVPGPEDRIVISTLQRMYRHFYIRLCDIADNATLVDSSTVNYAYLQTLGSENGLWQGIATYLRIVSDYVSSYRRHSPALPTFVQRAARFGTAQTYFQRDFLRVSILPHSFGLYASEFKHLLLNGEWRNSFRLSLLPCLATAAALEQKITGSDKGIW